MTWAWSLPVTVKPVLSVRTPPLNPARTRAIVPTFRDWDAARETIESLLACTPRPVEIVVVDDNHETDPPKWVRRDGIVLVAYEGNRGPSVARNTGAAHDTGRPIDWFYFTDTGCWREPDFFARLVAARTSARFDCVALAGPVHGATVSPTATPINHYMTVEGILNPPMDVDGPQAIVTANAAVCASAFRAAGGFDASYPFAAGEDLDLGIKLRLLGSVHWARHAAVIHRFAEDVDDFTRRFIRYGKGTAHLEHRMRLPSIAPVRFAAHEPALQTLADLQIVSMRRGYEQHRGTLPPIVLPVPQPER
ncbi:MAG: glycosyltransferase [Phycisphaerales bacterium]